MRNLRILSVQVDSSTSLKITFTEKLSTNLVKSNVSIISDASNIPNSEITKIEVSGAELSITCLPLTALGPYYVVLKSVSNHPFTSVNGDAIIIEDNVANKYFFLGPIEPENIIQNNLINYFKENIYNVEDDTTVVNKYIRSLSKNLSKALYDIRQLKNENYLSVNVFDERKTRGEGPFDRLNEEAAYEIVRVGKTQTGTNVSKTISFDSTPFYPIPLQREITSEDLTVDSVNENKIFNINGLILNLSKFPVTKVNKITFTIASINPTYEYNIESLGYQILDSKYDQSYAFTYLTLSSNQVKLNEKILTDPLFDVNNIIKITVDYEYKNLGLVLDNASLKVYTKYESIREVLPPIVNIFNLKHAPIVDGNGKIPTLGGLTISDPNSLAQYHPAFLYEIPFRLNGLPSIPGQYSVDYSTGTVYVYGADLNNNGTGPTPPLVSYNYEFVFKDEQDYSYDETTLDLVALPIGNMIENQSSIYFTYEQVLVPGVDYVTNLHKEELAERVKNKILALNSIRVNNSPITNVFRVYNETTGEIYTVDRWNNDKIYFRYFNAPNIIEKKKEKVSFNNIYNEMIFVDTVLSNIYSFRVFKILLNNNRIVSSTEEGIASSYNTSLRLSDLNIFKSEKWFNRDLSLQSNLDKLNTIGEYCVDYDDGIIYCAVSNTQDNKVGFASYKNSQIVLENPHIISAEDLYYQIDALGTKNKKINVTSFEDGLVTPEVLDYTDESLLNNNDSYPYLVLNSSVGSLDNTNFVAGVTNQVKFIRNLFEFNDLTNSTNPINFGSYSLSNNYNITVNSITKSTYQSVNFDGYDYYVLINENIPYLSPNITYQFSITRSSDLAQLWDNVGVVVPGNPVKLVLSGLNNPAIGDLVQISYTFSINNLSRVVIDYSRGDFLIDYTYLADEIIASYEYGDNVLDFRQSKTLSAGDQYFVSYKVGALRDSLLKNFGSLINVDELTNFNLDFNRERYRDALVAAMGSFILGPTIPAIKNIAQTISHIKPELIESNFQNWSLGNSLLNPQDIKTTGSFQLLPAKFSNGVLIDKPGQTISFPTSSNIRLEEGTFETWIIPQWSGIDNDAELTFEITKNNVPLNPSFVFIGSSEYHPEISSGKFSISKADNILGTPNLNKDGIFIYYDKDISNKFNRWYVQVIDGYITPSNASYKFKITSNGSFYDSKTLQIPQSPNINIFTGINTINFTITSINSVSDGITFISDIDHYLLDFGKEHNSNRVSLYKDISGYFNFRIYDENRNLYNISADVCSWRVGEPHHVAASWKIGNRDGRDEMHLFIDGLEVPNIFKFNQKIKPYLPEKFRTVDPEEIIAVANKDIVSSTDLVVNQGSAVVTSSINFSAYNINVGDTIYIDEAGFNPLGYTISIINGQSLTLNTNMPVSLTDARFSVNRVSFNLDPSISAASNIVITTLSPFVTGNDLTINIGSDIVSSLSMDFENLEVLPGHLIRIDNPSLPKVYTILNVVNNSLVLSEILPLSAAGETFYIYSGEEKEISGLRAVSPSYSISKDSNFNTIVALLNNVFLNDLVVIHTLGLNYKKIKQKYYVWSNNLENVIMTCLPPPISLDEAKITKVILPSTSIGPNNSILSGGLFICNNIVTSQTSNSQIGRTISVTISGNNVDFSTPVSVTITGVVGINIVNETITFNDYGTLDFANPYISVNDIDVMVKPLSTLKAALVIECKEKYSITKSEYSALVPVIRYSYLINSGNTLQSDGIGVVRDENNLFNGSEIGNYLVINYPVPVAGYYIITNVSEDRKSLTIQSTNTSFPLPLDFFTDGTYQIFNTTQYRSGLQNGFFTLEPTVLPSQKYLLSKGLYELEYATYTSIKMLPISSPTFIGSDFRGNHQINAIMDQVKIYSVMLTDTRVGETIPTNQRSITKDFNSVKALRKDSNTLSLINFDTFPFYNSADYYINSNDFDKFFQSASVVNENFGNSLVLLDKPISLENNGILNSKNQGTIEFWVSPLFDTDNDPNDRFYFDAYGAVIEETVSNTSTSIKLSSPASKILNVKLKNGSPKVDYFAGGKLEIDTQNAIQEQKTSISNTSVKVNKNILQVIKVEIIGDLTQQDYFNNGIIGTDGKTIYLGKTLPSASLPLRVTYKTTENKNLKINTQVVRLNKQLPYQNSEVIVQYIPQGLEGDRLSIFKDKFGNMNFSVSAGNYRYVISEPVKWAKGTWHRVKATFKFNGPFANDEIKLFLDGYQYSNVDVTSTDPNFIYDGYGIIPNIKFNDPINYLFIGTQYNGQNPVFSLIDNLRISNISRPEYAPYGYPIDVNYNRNTDVVFPITTDLYTTYLLDFDNLRKMNSDFANIKNRNTGSFDFSINILDSFGIVSGSIRVKEALEKLIKVLKPANSKVFITYTK